MKREQERGIVDQSALGMRVATFAAGVWLTYVVCTASAIYVVVTWERPHRAAIASLFGAGLVGAAVIAQLPRERIVRSRFRELFFFSWSVLDLTLIYFATLADGGTSSPIALIFFIPVVFAAMSYPRGSVLAVGGLTVGGYLALAVTVGGAQWGYQALFAVMLACTCAMSFWQARNHHDQRAALMEVSRADPLTGCLNRRGLEERAVAELGAASRQAFRRRGPVADAAHFKGATTRQAQPPETE